MHRFIAYVKASLPSVSVLALMTSMDRPLEMIFEAEAEGAVSKAAHSLAVATLLRETMNGHVVHLRRRTVGSAARRFAGDGDPQASLIVRERQVLGLLAAGARNGQIGGRLRLAEQTVKLHLSNVYRKLDVSNSTLACHYAHLHGLVGPQRVEGSAR